MKVCAVCNDIVSSSQGCDRSDCPIQEKAALKHPLKVEPGISGSADKVVQVGLDKVGDVARQTTRRVVFTVAVTLAVLLAAAVLLLNNTGKFGFDSAPSGLRYRIIQTGEGPTPTDNDIVLVSYKGMLKDGTVFDENLQASFPVTSVVPGLSQGLKLMQRGSKYRLWIPAELAYGPEDQLNPETGQVAIPGGSELTFDVELLEFKSRAEVEAMQKEMQKGSVGSGE